MFSHICHLVSVSEHISYYRIVIGRSDIADRIQIRQTFFIREMYFEHVTALSQLANDHANFRVRSQKRHIAVMPWMYLQMGSVIDQAVSLCNHMIYDQRTALYFWYTTICSLYLVLSVYFWMVVEAARNQWYNEQGRDANCESFMLNIVSTSTNSNPKSPSFLSQNFSMFEQSHPSTILPI
ncbi:PREDICTED: uncharacterized protein LOC105148973 isoform X2 [Acromyrmex echinatior]|uniref:uncharacterized protein LOC105148973 isoform X2 n=1 Tax=Acromyrmex echinatior TaxID=103372 RepID=UPI000580BF82|nr:PREDICTED: uncharacterized protein LOC105148973 isoform X2 [Acromyrmex echinatior]